MPKEVLHLLYEHDEAATLHRGEAIHINTHGVEHVVIQVERKRYARPPKAEVLAVEGHAPKALTFVRKKTDKCRHCRKPLSPQGKWKHELHCGKGK